MDKEQEYHDPDYPEVSTSVKKEAPSLGEEDKVEKIKVIIRGEFDNELKVRENEVMLLDQRLAQSRRLLHRLRYVAVNQYFQEQKLQLTPAQIQDEVAGQSEPRARSEVASLLRDSQRRLHPSVRKLLGKQTADIDEILYRSRAPRNKTRKDYSAMLHSKNYTIPADSTKSLRPEAEEACSSEVVPKPTKVPRPLVPKIQNVVTLDEAARNQIKYRYRIIIGNTSKYAPAASPADRSTHKWLLYVRLVRGDIARVLSAVTVRLHRSYAPHHTVHIQKPPFHVSRRGWGEFPARVELHFALPHRNRPAALEHTIKLDRHYTGLQTLGAETIVDVWLYSTPEMLEVEYKDDTCSPTETPTDMQLDTPLIQPKEEPMDDVQTDNDIDKTDYETELERENDSWLDFFSKGTTELDVDDLIIKPVKKVEEKNDLENFIDTNVINKEGIDNYDEIKENSIDNNMIDLNPKTNDTSHTENNEINNLKDVQFEEDLPNELLTQPTSPKKRIMKYMDPTTGKIYYLEMDRKLDLTKVQEIVINSKGIIKTAKISPIKPNGLKNVRRNVKKGVSLLKPEVKNLLKNEVNTKLVEQKKSFTHIENDHCYLGTPWSSFSESKKDTAVLPVKRIDDTTVVHVKNEKSVYNCLCNSISKFVSVRTAVNYLLKNIPLISSQCRDPDYVKHFPFVVETEEKYWKLDFAKRRNIEWSRSKLITKLLTEHFNPQHGQIWRTKQVLIFSRLHGYFPVRTDSITSEPINQEWSSWTDFDVSRRESNIKEAYPNASDISCLTLFDSCQFQDLSETLELSDSDEDIEIVNDVPVKVKKEPAECSSSSALTVLPVNEDDRLKFLFVEKKCSDIGIELRNEDIGNGYSYSAVHAVMLSAVKSFAEELIRCSFAAKLTDETQGDLPQVWMGWSSSPSTVSLRDVYAGARAGRLRALLAHKPAATHTCAHEI